MSYYHVLIETPKPSKKYYELDKTDLSEIKEEIVIPFLKSEQFMLDGYFLTTSNVERILIKESDYSSEEYATREQEKLSPNIMMKVVTTPEILLSVSSRSVRASFRKLQPNQKL